MTTENVLPENGILPTDGAETIVTAPARADAPTPDPTDAAPDGTTKAADAPPKKKPLDLVDILLLVGMALPLVAAMVLKILFTPASDGVNITGALIYLTIPLPLQPLYISEAQVNSWAVMITIFLFCLFLTRGLSTRGTGWRQVLAEKIVTACDHLVMENMGERFSTFGPFVAAIMALSAFSSLSSLLGLFPPTSDINIVAGWAILVFILITSVKLKAGLGYYLKGFTEPFFVMTPLNILSEFATPISLTFRHFGNVLSGVVVSTLLAYALNGLSSLVLGWIPVIGEIPWLRIGLPAVFSIYFDVLSGVLQAFIFAMLTIMYVGTAFPDEEAYQKHLAKRAKRKARLAKVKKEN